ncbi:tetratricopeptide repeat protein [Streptomyces sp. NPDC127098]|uniref:tetratricopeptide repeat protein n=1 Tax=Streptomyces sp. NPDC127098 TaxID=3347137 RepID=UPI003663C695
MTVLDHKFQRLPAVARRAYQVFGVLPGLSSIGVAEVAAAAGMPPAATADALQELVRCGLVERRDVHVEHDEAQGIDDVAGGRFRVPAGVLEHAVGQAEALGERDRASMLRRWLDHLLATATNAQTLVAPRHRILERDYAGEPQSVEFTNPALAWAWLETHQSNLVAAARTAYWTGWWGCAWQLVDSLHPLDRRFQRDEQWVKLYLDIAAPGARSVGNHRAGRRMSTAGAAALRRLGRYDEARALLYQVLHSARTDEDQAAEADALLGLGDIARATGQTAEAGSLHRKALALWDEAGHAVDAALARMRLGDLASFRGESAAAYDHLTRAREELVAAGNAHEAARAASFLARAHGQAGEHDQAQDLLRDVVDEFAACGSVLWQARALEWAGDLHQELGRHQEARAAYVEAFGLYDRRSPLDAARLARVRRELDRHATPAPTQLSVTERSHPDE